MRTEFSSRGINLPEIGLWLDPAADCETAWVSHGHSDHSHGCHARVIGTPETLEIYKLRCGEALAPWQEFRPLAYGETLELNGARLAAYPAGHILGAAQLLVERGGERLLYTGDVKLRPPLLGAETALVPCDRLIIESTFGLPIFHFLSREEARGRIVQFARECVEQEAVPVFLAHPLGRGQEVLHVLSEAGIPAAVHGALARFVPLYESRGFRFPGWVPYEGLEIAGQALVTVHGFRKHLEASGRNFRIAYVSGWAALDNARARAGAEELIPYSDHADFEELLALVERSGARQVDVVHGYTEAFAHVLAQRGYEARPQPGPFPRGAAAIREAGE